MDSQWTISTTKGFSFTLSCTARIDILLVQGLIALRQRYSEKKIFRFCLYVRNSPCVQDIDNR